MSKSNRCGKGVIDIGVEILESIAFLGLTAVSLTRAVAQPWLLRESPLTLDFFAKARWTERAPQMVHTLLVEFFENTGKIVSVARQNVDLRADYVLKTELGEFQAEYSDKGEVPHVWVKLNAKLVHMPARTIIASETFEAHYAVGGPAMMDIVVAFDDTLNKMLKKSVLWTMGRLR